MSSWHPTQIERLPLVLSGWMGMLLGACLVHLWPAPGCCPVLHSHSDCFILDVKNLGHRYPAEPRSAACAYCGEQKEYVQQGVSCSCRIHKGVGLHAWPGESSAANDDPLGFLKPLTYCVLHPLCCPLRFSCPCHSSSAVVPVLSPSPVFPPGCCSQSLGFYSTTISVECPRCPRQEPGRCGFALCLVRRSTGGSCGCSTDGWISYRFLQSLLGFPSRWPIRSVWGRETLEVPCF